MAGAQMPELNHSQFWKANPNQMALPGMEEHAHPGARLLSQGYHFTDEQLNDHLHVIRAHNPDGHEVGHMQWNAHYPRGNHRGSGEISWIESQGRNGIATDLYGIGRRMAAVKPQHSSQRTDEGDYWAPGASAKYGGRVPKLEFPT